MTRQRDSIGARLRNLRLEAGRSQKELASTVSVTQASLSNYESGKRDLPLWLAVELAESLGHDVKELLIEEG